MTRHLSLLTIAPLLAACASGAPGGDGAERDLAWVVSEESNDLFVFDTRALEPVASIDTSVMPGFRNANHMAIVSPDGDRVFVSATAMDAIVVVDATSMEVEDVLPLGRKPGHMSSRPGTDEIWVMLEGDDSVAVLDATTLEVTHRITDPSLAVPHFARFAGNRAYIANIMGNQVSVLDLDTWTVVDTLVAAGTEEGRCDADPCGFADAQITPDGTLVASHIATGTVLLYDTANGVRLDDVQVGGSPWSAFVDPFGDTPDLAFVPTWEDARVTRVAPGSEPLSIEAGDQEVYGVNTSPTAPEVAFVLNRVQERIRVIDRQTGAIVDTLELGGTTETATTTPDGLLLVPLSSADAVAVVDTATREEIARFADVGDYPWSVATRSGQNYCH